MRRLLPLVLLPLLTAAAPPAPVAHLKWHARVLLVFARPGDPALGQQQAFLDGAANGVRERDIAVVHIVGDKVDGAAEDARDLRHRYRVTPAAFTAILVGKDGGEKLRSTVPLSTAQMFGTIDAMPMRKDEMRKR